MTVATSLCPSVCCTKSSSPALMRSNRLAPPTTHPVHWNSPFSRVLLCIRSPWCYAVPASSFRASPFRWFAGTALAAIRQCCSMTEVRDLATADAAIRPSPSAGVDLSIELEQIVQALFHHETMTPCAFHNDLLCRLRSPKGRGGTSCALLPLQPLANCSPLRTRRDPNQ